MLNKVFVHHRSFHHAKNSGYAKLVDYMDAQALYGKARFPFRFWKFLADRHSQNGGIYDVGGLLKTIELYLFLKKHKNQRNIVHFLNGERDIRHLGILKKRFPNTFFYATFHKPPDILKEIITDVSALKKLDGAIAVGANQVDFIKKWLGLEHVVYIPHGVDTEFFRPNKSLQETNTLLFVGQHLRDFDILNRTIPKLAAAIKDLKVKVVIHPDYVSNIVVHPNIEVLTGVSDLELLKLYQQATLLYLPMLDSTACNSLLEAMACGLPIITSKVGGNMEYLEGTANILIEKDDEQDFIHQTVELLNDEDLRESIGKSSRNEAERLSWKNVALKVNNFYKLL